MNRSRLCLGPTRRAAGWSVVVIALAGAAGCDREDPVANAIDAAHAEARLLSNSAESSFWQRDAAERAGQIAAERGLTGDSTESREQSAALILAQAYRGQAILPLQKVQRLERESRDRITTIRGVLGQYDRLSSLAAASEAYDNDALVGEIDRLRAEVIDLQEANADRLRELSVQLEEERARFDRLSERASEQRNLAGALYLELGSANANDRIRLSEEAEEFARAAARLESDADEVRVRIDQLEPRVAELRLRVEEFAGQLEGLESTLQSSAERVQQRRQNGLDARRAAATAAETLASELSALQTMREGELSEAHTEAMGLLERALGTARKTDRRSVGGFTLAGIEQSIGDLHLTDAHGHGAYAEILESLATAVPALPGRAQLAAAAQSQREQETEHRTAAAERFRAAAETYEGIRGGDDDAMSGTVENLREIAASLVGEEYTPEGDDEYQDDAPVNAPDADYTDEDAAEEDDG